MAGEQPALKNFLHLLDGWFMFKAGLPLRESVGVGTQQSAAPSEARSLAQETTFEVHLSPHRSVEVSADPRDDLEYGLAPSKTRHASVWN